VPFRLYRLWVRLGKAVQSLVEGRALTDAAFDAGFSSPAHFSAAYRAMFGSAPSTLAKAAPVMMGSVGTATRGPQTPTRPLGE
jgi:AraC-like DNA-binding protein